MIDRRLHRLLRDLVDIPLVRWPILLSASLLVPSGACVPKGKYDDVVRDAAMAQAQAKAKADEAARRTADQQAEITRLNEAVSALEQQMRERDGRIATLEGTGRDLQQKLDAETAEDAQLRKELERLGKNADKLLAEKGTMATALEQAKARLEELRKAQAAADARAALFRQLALKFQKMIDAGELKIALRDGRMVIQLANDVLFDSGKTEIKPSGKIALSQVAAILKTLTGRRFQVGGHTDTVPIHTPRFPSNWELSTARAVEVVQFLVAQGLRPETLSAGGYGEFDPIAPNDSDGSRARNRRIEITLQPNIDELVAVPSVK
jgi:chemotaxis protein MotB